MNNQQIVELANVCNVASSSIAQKDLAENNGNYPIYGASGHIQNVDFYKQEKPYIAIVKDGAGVGRVMLLPEKSSIISTMQYILPNENVDINFLYFALVKMNLAKYFTGATIPHIYFKDYKKEKLILPSREKQRKIASILCKVKDLISFRNMQLDILNLMVKSRFVEMFGDPLTNRMGWEKKPFGETCDITTGNTPPRANLNYYGDFIEWIKTDNIKTSEMTLTRAAEQLSEEGFSRCRYVEAGSVLMTCIAGSLNSIGNVAVTDRRVAFNQQINALTPKAYNCLFLYSLLTLMKPKICNAVNMMLKGILSKGRLSEIEAITPPLPLQSRFADFARQVDKSKFEIQQGLKKLEVQYNALVQQYFG